MGMAVIEVDGLHKRYGSVVAVDDVSFTVEEGEIFGVLGRNGAGKTTAVESIAGLRKPDAGTVRVLGMEPRSDRRKVRNVLGVQLQEGTLPDKARVAELMRLYRSFYAEGADPDRLLAELGLDDKREAFIDDLSGGQQQRLSIALALIGNPRVAILDELTTGLDPQARRDTWDLIEQIRDAGVTIVLVTHFMEEAQRLCDRVAIIDGGRVAALDAPRAIVARVDGRHRLRLRTAERFPTVLLDAVPEVTDVRTEGGEVVVTGTGNLLHAVTGTLLAHDVVVTETRMEQASLDDAFLAITGRELHGNAEGGESSR